MNERIEKHTQDLLDQPERTVAEQFNEIGAMLGAVVGLLVEKEVLNVDEFWRIKTQLLAEQDQAIAAAQKRRQEEMVAGHPKASAFLKKILDDL